MNAETLKPGARCKVYIARQYFEGRIRGGGWRVAEVVEVHDDANWVKLTVQTRDGVVWPYCHHNAVRAA